jgi:hypothetical protein
MTRDITFFEYINISVTHKTKRCSFILHKEVFAARIIKIYFVTYFSRIRAIFSDKTFITEFFRVLSEFSYKMALNYY